MGRAEGTGAGVPPMAESEHRGIGEPRVPGTPPKPLWGSPLPPPDTGVPPLGLLGLIPPSHFTLRPASTRPLGAGLEAEKRRGQDLEAELYAEKRRSQALEAELEAEKRRSHALEAELEAEKRRGQGLEVELEAERGRVQSLEAELVTGRRRGQARGAEPDGGQPMGECQAQVLFQARLSALGHILTLQEHELGRELPPSGVPMAMAPPQLQALLGRWREKVFTLLVQLRVQEEAQRVLRAQVGTLEAAVAAGTRRVTRLGLSLRERAASAELQRRDTERLAQEVMRQRGRAEAAEEALGELARAAARLAGVVTAREAEVTAATRSMVTLSARLRRAGQRLRVLQGLVAPAVALDRPWWQQDPAGDNPVPKVTGSAHRLAGMVAKVRRSGTALGAAEEVTHSWVTKDEVTQDEAIPREDRTGHLPSRAALGSLVTQLQALGAAILGDDGDNSDSP
ncbi:coiled-coil alpha-helical rod protein 1-like isoform X2 [Tyto alba]|uniref:coiled-coil alpha-helical rod protein 1-like isoform X2 n=1 Tax=Tyto alba TaxID=56313 RepID=UPI001C677049|nr:coiled-coil alpha-helical rod protein 1-like isoform X2 [Tyto alba]